MSLDRFLKFLVTIAVFLPIDAEAAGDCRLAAMGDSLTAGYGLPFEQSFPAQLQDFLNQAHVACEVQNHGVSGETSAGGLARTGWVLGAKPSHLILELGANDGLRALPVDAMRSNLAGIIDAALGAGVDVMIAGMVAPPNLGAEYTGEFAAVFPELAARYDLPLYPFFMDGVIGNPALIQQDGLHPNNAGVAVIVENFGPKIVNWLRSGQ